MLNRNNIINSCWYAFGKKKNIQKELFIRPMEKRF